jgi:hypothetical protein
MNPGFWPEMFSVQVDHQAIFISDSIQRQEFFLPLRDLSQPIHNI